MLHALLALTLLADPAPEDEPAVPPPEGDSAGETPDADRFTLDIAEALPARRSTSPQASAAILTTATMATLESRMHLRLSDYLATIPGFDRANAYWYSW